LINGATGIDHPEGHYQRPNDATQDSARGAENQKDNLNKLKKWKQARGNVSV